MKKINFAAAAVLLAAILAACNAFPPDEVGNPPVYYDDNGRQLVEVSIGAVGAARSLIGTEAKNYSNYYEVVFLDGTDPLDPKYYHLSWRGASPARIRIPPLDYDGADNKAILFAGTQSKLLVAIGRISAVNGVSGTTEVISSTTSITFAMSALDAVIDKADGDESAFKITKGDTTPLTPSGSLPTVTYEGNNIPVFELDENDTGIEATYTIDLLGGSDWDGVVMRGNGRVNSASFDDITDRPAKTLASAPNTNLTADDSFTGTVVIEMETETGGGLCEIFINLPVCAFATTTGSAESWVIRSGIRNEYGYFDDGSGLAPGGLNGLILLGIGNYDSVSPNPGNPFVEIEIDP